MGSKLRGSLRLLYFHVVGPLGAGIPDQSQYEGEGETTKSIARMIIDVPAAIINQAPRRLAICALRQLSDGAIFERINLPRRGSDAVQRGIVEGNLATRAIRYHYWGGIHASSTFNGSANL
jgi:hypothetical protein